VIGTCTVRWLFLVIVACGDNLVGTRDAPASPDDAASDAVTDVATDATPDAPDAMTDALADAPDDARPSSVVVVPCTSFVAVVETTAASFTPTAISIHVGDVIRFAPSSPHDVRSGTPASPEDRFTVDGGAPRCLRFDEAGTFPFYCQVHPTMTGSVLVAP